MTRRVLFAAFVCLASNQKTAWGIPPPYVSDEELAHMPVIVEARWNKTAFTAHDDDVADFEHSAGRTTLTITRVIKGDVKPGEQVLYMGFRVGWEKSGGTPTSYMSTMMSGDVEDVCQSNLWCLNWEKSRHTTTGESYVTLTTYRGVQPLALEPYFRAFDKDNPEDAVRDLLAAGNGPVCLRCLEFVNGDLPPWPYWGEFDEWFRGAPDRSRIRKSLAPEVKTLMRHKDAEVRRKAIATYGSVLEAASCSEIRDRLTDADDGARAIAIAILATHRDESAINLLNEASKDIRDAHLGCAAIDRLAQWGDVRLVPAMIWFLDAGEYAGSAGDNVFIPSLRAQSALKKIVGFQFPRDAARSMKAWKAVARISDSRRRVSQLAELLPDSATPLVAKAVGNVDRCDIVLSNTDQRSWTVTTMPATLEINITTSSGSRGRWATTKEDFVDLKPGDSIKIPVQFPDGFLQTEPSKRQVRLHYTIDGHKLGFKAWLGKLDVSFDEGWNEPKRDVVDGDEFWPNGNWKARGKLLFGKRIGRWEFFNEAGDRLRTVEYSGGGGNAECNPEHPDNKGAGKRETTATHPLTAKSPIP